MRVQSFVEILGSDFFTGVPDSQLKALCNYLMNAYGIDKSHHIVSANEGTCVSLAAGYHLATGKTPVVYMQNSGEGNIINPVASLLNSDVYAIPMIFVVGWRGEPGVHDEPQHAYQGKVTVKLLEDMDISVCILEKDASEEDVSERMREFKKLLSLGKQVAFVVKKGALTYDTPVLYKNSYALSREEVIRHIVNYTGSDPVVCTTGKASRELFEIREAAGGGHGKDFLTVGSMGHASSIALGIALSKPEAKVWCIDGDGAFLMHMGSCAIIGANAPKNLVHIVINNSSHETVGGVPTVMSGIDVVSVARAVGYEKAVSVGTFDDLDNALREANNSDGLCLIEVKCALGARENLGRPTTTALENKNAFMNYLSRL